MSKETYVEVGDIISKNKGVSFKDMEKELIAAGAIPMNKLTDGEYYKGVGSVTHIGMWDAEIKAFVQLKTNPESGRKYAYPTNHFSDYAGTDYFVPVARAYA